MPSVAARQQRVGTSRPALAGHVHVDLHIGARRVVHHVGDVVVVALRLPRLQFRILKQMLVSQGCDKSLSLRHVHVQGRIAHVSGTVVDEGGLQYIVAPFRPPEGGKLEATIHKGVHFLELREVHLLVATCLVVVGMAIEGATVDVEPLRGVRAVSPIDLHVAVGLVASLCIQSV